MAAGTQNEIWGLDLVGDMANGVFGLNMERAIVKQTSIDPPRFLACLSRPNRTARVAEHAEHLCVHIAPRSDRRLAELFGGVTGDEADKFAGVAWTAGPHGLPVLDDCPRWFAGRILGRFDLGDHVGYLLAPQEGSVRPAGPPLMLQQTDSIEPGHPA